MKTSAVMSTASDPNPEDTVADGTLRITSVGNAVNGSVTLSNGVITFTPKAGFTGRGHFDYMMSAH